MPILEFYDIKDNRQSYDFSDISLCRLSSIYISFREASENTELSDELRHTATQFAGFFQAMQGMLNQLVSLITPLEARNVVQNTIKSHIEIEHENGYLCNVIEEITKRISKEELEHILGTANRHVIEHIFNDFSSLQAILIIQHTKIIHTGHSYVELCTYADSWKKDMQPFLQLLAFLNIYLDDPIHKPVISAPLTLIDTTREITRISASFLGSFISTTARAVGADIAAIQDTDAWLQSWNHRHRPINMSRRSGIRMPPV